MNGRGGEERAGEEKTNPPTLSDSLGRQRLCNFARRYKFPFFSLFAPTAGKKIGHGTQTDMLTNVLPPPQVVAESACASER